MSFPNENKRINLTISLKNPFSNPGENPFGQLEFIEVVVEAEQRNKVKRIDRLLRTEHTPSPMLRRTLRPGVSDHSKVAVRSEEINGSTAFI